MSNKKTNIAAGVLIGFIALVIIVTSVVIYQTPSEVVSGTAGNYSINLVNGGNILEDEGFLFYTIPGKKGVYRMESSNPKSVKKISDIGDGNLQVIGSGYYFTDDNILYRVDWEGNRKQVVRKNARRPKIVGSLVFYSPDTNSSIYKYSMQNDTKFDVMLDKSELGQSISEFLVYYKKIYFIENGNIYSCSFNGSKRELFLEANASQLSIDGEYFFYIEDGMLKSVKVQNNQVIKADIVKAKSYAIFGSYIVYSDDTGTYYAEINTMLSNKDYKPKKLSDKTAKSISIDDENFYFFIDETFHRISHDGKDLIALN